MRTATLLGFFALVGCTRLNPAFDTSALDASASGGNGSTCDPTRLQSDPQHCGGCDNDCTALPHVDPARVGCQSGVCSLGGACQPGWADCSSVPGCETDLSTSNHCGSCNNVCSGATALCTVDGSGHHVCAAACSALTPDLCGTQCVDLRNDPTHCGSCANACPVPARSHALCNEGVCAFSCDGANHACNGVCVPDGSPQSCGGSCTPCPAPSHGYATCDGVSCGFGCDGGYVPSGNGCVPAGSDMSSCDPLFGCGNGGDLSSSGGGDLGSGNGGDMSGCGITGTTCMRGSDCCSGQCLFLQICG